MSEPKKPATEGKRNKDSKSAPWISAFITLLLLLILFEKHIDFFPLVQKRLLWPLIRLFMIMGLSLSLSALVEGMGWSSAVAGLSRPLMRLGRFSDWSGTAFTTAFISGVAANTLIWNSYKEGRIDRREMVLAVLLNQGLPSYALHLPTTLAIILPLVGKAGLIYVTITLAAAILRTIIKLTAGRIMLKGSMTRHKAYSEDDHKDRDTNRGWPRVKVLLKKYLVVRLSMIACYTIPIYIGVVLLQEYGFFQWLQQQSTALIPQESFPVEGISVVVFTIVAEFTAGAAAAGAMLATGVLTVKETVLALLLGNIIATPFRALRHQLPRYLGIFKPGTGTQLLLMGQTLRVFSVIISGGIFYYLG